LHSRKWRCQATTYTVRVFWTYWPASGLLTGPNLERAYNNPLMDHYAAYAASNVANQSLAFTTGTANSTMAVRTRIQVLPKVIQLLSAHGADC
jgi:hypothetical protein